MPAVLSVFDIVDDAAATDRSQNEVMTTYFGLGSRLELNWLRDRIIELPRANRWQALARAALRDDLCSAAPHADPGRASTSGGPDDGSEGDRRVAGAQRGGDRARARRCSPTSRRRGTYDTTTLPVALREVRNLIRTTNTGTNAGPASVNGGPEGSRIFRRRSPSRLYSTSPLLGSSHASLTWPAPGIDTCETRNRRGSSSTARRVGSNSPRPSSRCPRTRTPARVSGPRRGWPGAASCPQTVTFEPSPGGAGARSGSGTRSSSA